MSSAKAEVEEFLLSDENIFGFELKSSEKEQLVITIAEEFDFSLKVLGSGKFSVSSKEEILEDWCKDVNTYCNQGKKTVTEVLLRVFFFNFLNQKGDRRLRPHDWSHTCRT
jgi:hypothetical protein